MLSSRRQFLVSSNQQLASRMQLKLLKAGNLQLLKGGKKDPEFSDGGIAKLNAELNQLPEYYLPMADGGIANHFRKNNVHTLVAKIK